MDVGVWVLIRDYGWTAVGGSTKTLFESPRGVYGLASIAGIFRVWLGRACV